jgi:uncharacterized membrane protein
MPSIMDTVSGLGGKLETLLLVVAVIGGILALGVAVYVLRSIGSMLTPFAITLRFLFGVRPGEEPGELVAGLILGLRLFVWSAIGAVAVAFWISY